MATNKAKKRKWAKGERPKLRYGVMYYNDIPTSVGAAPNRWGSTAVLAEACGNAARHVAKSDFFDNEYPMAVIYDKWDEKIIRAYKRTSEGIKVKDY